MKKTNAARRLDQLKIDYDILAYKIDPRDLSAEHVSSDLGIPLNRIFKTLVARGDKTGVIVACVPGDAELNLKYLANISGNKKVHLVPLKEIKHLTGYIRGGVSPLGMKHSYPIYIDEKAQQYDYILVSAGIRGEQIRINPHDLMKTCEMNSGIIT